MAAFNARAESVDEPWERDLAEITDEFLAAPRAGDGQPLVPGDVDRGQRQRLAPDRRPGRRLGSGAQLPADVHPPRRRHLARSSRPAGRSAATRGAATRPSRPSPASRARARAPRGRRPSTGAPCETRTRSTGRSSSGLQRLAQVGVRRPAEPALRAEPQRLVRRFRLRARSEENVADDHASLLRQPVDDLGAPRRLEGDDATWEAAVGDVVRHRDAPVRGRSRRVLRRPDARYRHVLGRAEWKNTVSSTCCGEETASGGSSGSIRTTPSSVSTARRADLLSPLLVPHRPAAQAAERSLH